MKTDKKNQNTQEKGNVVYLREGSKEIDVIEETEEFVSINVTFRRENYEKLKAMANFLTIDSKLKKINDVTYVPEDFIKGATMYFIDAMLEDIDYKNENEYTEKMYKYTPNFLPILHEAAKKLENEPTENVEPLIKQQGVIKNNIKKIMLEKNLTQKQLSEMTGIDKANISIYLNNKSQPSIEFFLRIWHALNYPPLNQILYKESNK